MTSKMVKGLIVAMAFVLTGAVARTSHANTYRFCASWRYIYMDAGIGEDYLLNNQGIGGTIKAHRTIAVVRRNGQQLWAGYLNSNGCTPTVSALAGSYEFAVGSLLQKQVSGTPIRVEFYNDDSSPQPSFSWVAQLAGTSTAQTYNVEFGALTPIASAIAPVVRALNRGDHGGFRFGTHRIYANQDCPSGGDACAKGSSVYLGPDSSGLSTAYNKSTVAHEIGHVIMDRLMGFPDSSYTMTSTNALCRCDHIDPPDNKHCIQSRHQTETAQIEGWGHFYATNLYNNGSQNDAYFGYYKPVLLFGETQPPVVIDMYNPIRWMQQICPAADNGIEADWSGFYWHLHNKGSSSNRYSFLNFRDVYLHACGCTIPGCICGDNSDTPWSDLTAAVNDLYGFGSSKANHWVNTGATFGVNY